MADMPVSSTHSVPGKEIKESLGLVFGTTIRSRGAFGRFMAGLEAIAGGRSHSYIVELDKARAEAIDNMKKSAVEKGADAVVAVDLDISEVLEGFIMVTATGTGVKVK